MLAETKNIIHVYVAVLKHLEHLVTVNEGRALPNCGTTYLHPTVSTIGHAWNTDIPNVVTMKAATMLLGKSTKLHASEVDQVDLLLLKEFFKL